MRGWRPCRTLSVHPALRPMRGRTMTDVADAHSATAALRRDLEALKLGGWQGLVPLMRWAAAPEPWSASAWLAKALGRYPEDPINRAGINIYPVDDGPLSRVQAVTCSAEARTCTTAGTRRGASAASSTGAISASVEMV